MRNEGNNQLDIRTYVLEEFIAMHMQKMSPSWNAAHEINVTKFSELVYYFKRILRVANLTTETMGPLSFKCRENLSNSDSSLTSPS